MQSTLEIRISKLRWLLKVMTRNLTWFARVTDVPKASMEVRLQSDWVGAKENRLSFSWI